MTTGKRSEINRSQEENERLKIEVKDMKAAIHLSTGAKSLNEDSQKTNEVFLCKECEYPFRTENSMNQHIKNHKTESQTIDGNSSCNICSVEVTSVMN